MEDKIVERFSELLVTGEQLQQGVGYSREYGQDYWITDSNTSQAQKWISSASFLIKQVCPTENHYVDELSLVLGDANYRNGSNVPVHTIQKVFGIFEAVYDEYKRGSLKDYKYVIFASAFDDFLDHAEKFHADGKKIEASVLASIVLEDIIKKIASKNEVQAGGIEETIDSLVKAGVFTDVRAKRIKGLCGVRQKALHADWDAFDLRDVGLQIEGIKKLIEEI